MKLIYICGFAIFGAIYTITGLAFTDVDKIGQHEFQKNCAVCHGMDGKGGGQILDILKQAPPDLTLITQRHGGSFPYKKIYRWIEDPSGTRGHGSQEMPVWGQRYSREEIMKYGEFDFERKGVVQARILELVFFHDTAVG